MWDQRYSEPGFSYGTEPNDFLAANAERYLPPNGDVRGGARPVEQGPVRRATPR